MRRNQTIPVSWELVPLRMLLDTFASGSRPKGGVKHIETGVPSLGGEHLNRNGGFSFENIKYVPKDFAANMKRGHIKKGDILVVKDGATTGKTSIVRQSFPFTEAVINEHLFICRCKNGVDSKYVFYFLFSSDGNRQILEDFRGAAQGGISQRFADIVQVPIAPLKEQKRIAVEIEKQFSRLDEAVAALKRIKANLKRYKASVLKAAVEGKFTEVTNDEQYFNRDEWQSIDFVIESLDQGWSPRCERQPSEKLEEWGVIKTTAVQPFHYLEKENKKLPEKLVPRPNIEVKQGDILVTRAGPRKRVGITCLVRHTRPRLMFCDKVYRIKCKSDVISHGYLELVLNAPQIVDDLNKLKTGISDSGVNLTQKGFGNLKIPLPPIKVQEQIESEVERLLSISEDVEKDLELNILRSERLRQLILKKAFSGKLIPQEAIHARVI